MENSYEPLDAWAKNAIETMILRESSILDDKIAANYLPQLCCEVLSSPSIQITESTILITVNQLYNFTLNSIEWSSTLLEILLFHSVSEECGKQSEFVQRIMELESDLQLQLKLIIETFREHHINKDNNNSENIGITEISYVSEFNTKNCYGCFEKLKQIDKFQSNLSEKVEECERQRVQFKNNLLNETNKMIQLELVVIEKEDKIHQQEKRIRELENTTLELEQVVEKSNEFKNELMSLQDELDVLRPQSQRLVTLETQVVKLREKCEDTNQLKQQLKAESIKHVDTLDELLATKQELETLKRSKVQLDEFKKQYTELMIEFNEMKAIKSKLEERTQAMDLEIMSLREIHRDHETQSQYLATQLDSINEDANMRDSSRTMGIGEGIIELNPQIMIELNALRQSNQILNEKLEKSSIDQVERIEKELEASNMVVNSLQQKWMVCKEELNQSKLQSDQWLKKFEMESKHCRDMVLEKSELCDFHREEMRSQACVWEERCQEMKLSHETVLLDRDEVITDFQNNLSDLDRVLSDKSEQLESVKVQNNELQLHCQELLEKNKNLIKKHEVEAAEQLQSFEEDSRRQTQQIEELVRNHEVELNAMKGRHEAEINDLRSELLVNSQCLEEETKKRRKVERVKKFLDCEIIKYKSQLQLAECSSNGGGVAGQDIDNAVKEMKSMQQQLDEAYQQIVELKKKSYGVSLSHDTKEKDLASTSSASQEVPLLGSSKIVHEGKGVIGGLRNGPLRNIPSSIHHLKDNDSVGDVHPGHGSATSTMVANRGGSSSTMLNGFIEHSELSDRKIEQLMKEKRELLAKSMEENKEKMELSQKLLVSEKEINHLQSLVRKITLEKERIEWKFLKIEKEEKENLTNKYHPVG